MNLYSNIIIIIKSYMRAQTGDDDGNKPQATNLTSPSLVIVVAYAQPSADGSNVL